MPPRRTSPGGRSFIPLLPIALVWLVVAAVSHAPAMIIPIVLLCILSVRVAGGGAITRARNRTSGFRRRRRADDAA